MGEKLNARQIGAIRQQQILTVLTRPMTASEIASETGIPLGRVHTNLNFLKKRGKVCREDDKRLGLKLWSLASIGGDRP